MTVIDSWTEVVAACRESMRALVLADPTPAEHPAKFPTSVLLELDHVITAEADRIGRRLRVIDPFAGTGRIHKLSEAAHFTVGCELEPEWAIQGLPGLTWVGDSTATPFPDSCADVIATSPCMAQEHRVLTEDLRWVAVGDVEPGDRLMAFDEQGQGTTARGTTSRRRWRRTEVVRSVPRSVECVRVILAHGDEVVTTPEHPWLAYRYAYPGPGAEWVPSRSLGGSGPLGKGRAGQRQPFYVCQQMTPWSPRVSYEAGWLAGMFDGEGSLSPGGHGHPKMTVCQVLGPVLDRMEELMTEFGYKPSRYERGRVDARQIVGSLHVTGGFATILQSLGELRPMRLLERWADMDVSDRTVEAERVAVLAVEPAGRRDIQEIETTEGTYFGEGYMMHNCYGNRLADHHEAKDACSHTVRKPGGPVIYPLADCPKCKGSGLSQRNTYRHKLGRMPARGSSAILAWGSPFRRLHAAAIQEWLRLLVGGGLIALNVSNHLVTVTKGEDPVEVRVVEWFCNEMMAQGCNIVEARRVSTRRNGNGANRDVRVDGEMILVMRAPAKPAGTLPAAAPHMGGRRTENVTVGPAL